MATVPSESSATRTFPQPGSTSVHYPKRDPKRERERERVQYYTILHYYSNYSERERENK